MKRASTQSKEQQAKLLSPVSVGSVTTRSSSRKKARKTFVIDLSATASKLNTAFTTPILSAKIKTDDDDKLERLEKRLRRYRQKIKDKDYLELNLRETISKLNVSLDEKTIECEIERSGYQQSKQLWAKEMEEKQVQIDEIMQENKALQEELEQVKNSSAHPVDPKGRDSLYTLQMENMQEKLFAKNERVSTLELELSRSKRKIEALEQQVQEMRIEVEAKRSMNNTIS